MRNLMIAAAALGVAMTAVPLQAQPYGDFGPGRSYVDYGVNHDDWNQPQRGDGARFYTIGDRDDDRRDFRDDRRDDRRDFRDDRKAEKRARQDARRDGRDWQRGRNYGYNQPDPRYNGYYADNYYRGGNYQPRQLGVNERIYRGQDNRYYCRRNDGTTGLIVGALGGGVLGNVIAPGGSKTLGSIIGGTLGAVVGKSVNRNNVSCR